VDVAAASSLTLWVIHLPYALPPLFVALTAYDTISGSLQGGGD